MHVTPPKLIAALLTLLAPIVVGGGGLAALHQYDRFVERESTTGEKRELKNAGRVMNGRSLKRGVVDAMETTLERTQPEVLILGNSTANTNIVPAVIARELGIKPKKVVTLSVPNSVGSHWYAILKNRVYANGHQPRLVVVVSPLVAMLLSEPFSEASYLNLYAQMGEEELVLDEHVSRPNPTWAKIRENRGVLREASLNSIRDAAVGLFFGGEDVGAETDAAMDRLFSDDKVDHARHVNALPVAHYEVTVDPSIALTTDASMLAQLAEIATEHGSKLVFLRTPMAPSTPPEKEIDLPVPEGTEADVTALLEDAGHLFVDMETFPVLDAHFNNVGHMNNHGANQISLAFAELIRELGLLKSKRRRVSVDLFGEPVLEQGIYRLQSVQARYTTPPPKLPRGERPPASVNKQRRVARFLTRDLANLEDGALGDRTPYGARCSPIRVKEDSTLLPLAHDTCPVVKKRPTNRICHAANSVRFGSTDGTNPMENGRKYKLALDPDRSCLGAQWLYPRDRMRAPIPAEMLEPFKRGARTLKVTAFGTGKSGQLRVKILASGRQILDRTIALEGTEAKTVALPLKRALRPTDTDVELRIQNPAGGLFMVTSAVLTVQAP